jgi:hypothetical protein
MSDEQLELFFKREHIYGKNKRKAYKQFVHNTNYRNVPCHLGSLTILRHHEMDATWSKIFPRFLIKDVRKAEKVVALNGITNTETLKSIWLFSSKASEASMKLGTHTTKQWEILKYSQYEEFRNKVYDTAYTYVKMYRPEAEHYLFTKLFPKSTWIDNTTCFVSIYQKGKNEGVRSHRDWVSFCVVTVCLLGDSCVEGSLVLTMHDSTDIGENNHSISVQLKEGDFIAYGRFFHHVPFCKRIQDRCTLNFFF